MKRYHWILLSIVIFVLFFILSAILYDLWFDTWDKIKYDKTYSPEVKVNLFWENFVFYATIFVGLFGVIFSLVKAFQFKKKV